MGKKELKILELTNYSAGVCGVWTRVKEEALRLKREGFNVRIFSSNSIKGSNKKASFEEDMEGVKIRRFKSRKLGGESFMTWDFKKEAIKYSPDIIISHAYRHPHTTKSLKILKNRKCKKFLVTHAPFDQKTNTRNPISMLAVKFYDNFISPKTIKHFDKVIHIAAWEKTHLKRLGVEKNLVYIPNGIPEKFFEKSLGISRNKIIYLGRISPIKNLEVLIKAMALIEDNQISLDLVGPTEKKYGEKLKKIIHDLNLNSRINFTKPIYDLDKKISKIDSGNVFVLPSKREGMPQSLIEAMARGKIVISSKNPGSTELINDGWNGYIFNSEDAKDLANKINLALKGNKKMQENARKSVVDFSWKRIIKKLKDIILE
jgi:glycosyltransferase involved in cell wall biosynthesis